MKKIVPFLLGLSAAQVSFAQSRIYVNEYLNIGVGARGLSMAGAQSAGTTDIYAAYWNPAGLVNMDADVQAGLMHAEYFGGISKYDYGSIAMPLKNKDRAIGISFIRFATDNIPYTLDYVRPDGSFDESKLKGISAGDYAALLSYAQRLHLFKNKPELETRIGANAKVLYRNIGSMANAWGFGLDLGFQVGYKQWRFGLAMKDITTSYTAWSFNLTEQEKKIFGETGNEIPVKSYEVMLPRFNFGIGRYWVKPEKNFQVFTEFGFDMTTDGKRATILSSKSVSIDPRFGIEASYKNAIFLRGGVNNFYRVYDNKDTTNTSRYTVFQPSVGVGFKIKSLSVDYAFTSLQVQDAPLMSHVVSIRLDFNKAKKAQQDEGSTPSKPEPVLQNQEQKK